MDASNYPPGTWEGDPRAPWNQLDDEELDERDAAREAAEDAAFDRVRDAEFDEPPDEPLPDVEARERFGADGS